MDCSYHTAGIETDPDVAAGCDITCLDVKWPREIHTCICEWGAFLDPKLGQWRRRWSNVRFSFEPSAGDALMHNFLDEGYPFQKLKLQPHFCECVLYLIYCGAPFRGLSSQLGLQGVLFWQKNGVLHMEGSISVGETSTTSPDSIPI